MLSKGSCFTGRNLSHGADVFRLRGGGGWAIVGARDSVFVNFDVAEYL